jgi:hypothetical protein
MACINYIYLIARSPSWLSVTSRDFLPSDLNELAVMRFDVNVCIAQGRGRPGPEVKIMESEFLQIVQVEVNAEGELAVTLHPIMVIEEMVECVITALNAAVERQRNAPELAVAN